MTNYAKLTFPGKIEIDTKPLSLVDRIYFEIGDIRDICQCIELESLFDSEQMPFRIDREPPFVSSYKSAYKPRPTFCKGVTEVLLSDGNYHLAISKIAFFNEIR